MRIAYFRTSTAAQSVEAQRQAMGGDFDREFVDEGVSGALAAAERPAFARLLAMVRSGDTVCVYAVDRLGRDAIDIQSTVRSLIDGGVVVEVCGLGAIGGPAGGMILAVMSAFAEAERTRIAERTSLGIAAARRSLAETGRTQHGKASLGRPAAADAVEVISWRATHRASARDTAIRFGISASTVKRYCKEAFTEAAPEAAQTA